MAAIRILGIFRVLYCALHGRDTTHAQTDTGWLCCECHPELLPIKEKALEQDTNPT